MCDLRLHVLATARERPVLACGDRLFPDRTLLSRPELCPLMNLGSRVGLRYVSLSMRSITAARGVSRTSTTTNVRTSAAAYSAHLRGQFISIELSETSSTTTSTPCACTRLAPAGSPVGG